MASSCRAAKLISTLERGDKSQQQGGNRTLGAVTRDTFTVMTLLVPREIGVVRMTGLSRDKFIMGNIHSYLKKKKETAHHI